MAKKNIKLKNSSGDYLEPYTENIPTATTTTAGKVQLDETPTESSTNALTSGAAYTALAGKLGTDDTAAKATADADGNEFSSTYAKKTDISDIENKADMALSLAEGSTRASAYATYAEAIQLINIASESQYHVGDPIFIQALDVPDLWVYSKLETNVGYNYTTDEAFLTDIKTNGRVQIGWYEISVLETGKVELGDYIPTTRTINGKPLSSDVTLSATDVGALATDGTAAKATADADGNTISSTYAKLSDVILYEEN